MMKHVFLSLFFLFMLWACGQSGNSNLRPRTGTSDAVLANINLGVEYLRRGNYEKSLDKLETARKLDPYYYETYNMLGLLYQQLRKPEQAERYFKKALSLNKNDSRTLNNYGRFLCQSKRPDEAEQMFNSAADNPLYETPEIAITNAGLCASLNNNLEKAEYYLRKALAINPKIPDALLKMSEVSYGNNNHLSARAYLQRYLEIAKHTPKTLLLGIRIEKELGDENAVSSYALLLKNTFPDSEEAKELKQAGTR